MWNNKEDYEDHLNKRGFYDAALAVQRMSHTDWARHTESLSWKVYCATEGCWPYGVRLPSRVEEVYL
jgi:hypothetical protein